MRARVAVDHHHEPDAVVDVAIAWAERLGATVDLLFVHDLPPGPVEVAEHVRLLDRIPPPLRGAALVRLGRPAEAIVADPHDSDVIMLGTHGWRGLAHLVLGSVAERVVRTASLPVLVLRSAPSAGELRALVAVDASRVDAARTLDIALPWLQDLGARVDLAHVERLFDAAPYSLDGGGIDVGAQALVFEALAVHREQDRAALDGLLARVPGPMRGSARSFEGEPAHRLAAATQGYDLAVLATHGRAGLERLWLGSVAEATVRLATCTVLVLRQPEAGSTAPTPGEIAPPPKTEPPP